MKINKLLEIVTQHSIIIISLIVLYVALANLFFSSVAQTQGNLIYDLDDAYIHMAMAKNFAQHGVYGVTPYAFSSSSSSILWTLLLACAYWLFGVREILPLLLNILLASCTLTVAYYSLRRAVSNKIVLLLLLFAIIFLTPLPAMIFCGMEHVLHILLIFLFLPIAMRILLEKELTRKNIFSLLLLTVLLVLTRFESYALVGMVFVLLLLQKRWKIACAMLASAAIPLLIYQYISISHGWSWLPNSILIRSNVPDIFNSQQAIEIGSGSLLQRTGFFANIIHNVVVGNHLYVLAMTGLIIALIILARIQTIWNLSLLSLVLFVVSAFAQLQFGKIGHFYRYEAYLIAWGILAGAIAFAELFKFYHITPATLWKRWIADVVIVALAAIIFRPIFIRGLNAWNEIPVASRNIYEQQYQIGLFLKIYYPHAVVAANDIGAISFLTNIKVFDLVGLASVDVLNLKMHHQYSQEQIKMLSQRVGTQIAVVYDSWLDMSGLNADSMGWKKVGEWIIQNNVVCGSDRVSFYALQAKEEALLQRYLKEYSGILPRAIVQQGRYLQSSIERK